MKIKLIKSESAINTPTDYFVLADNSGSMYGSIKALRETIMAVSDLMSPKDTITVGTFSSYGDYDFFVRGVNITDKNLKKLVDTKVDARGLTCFTQSLAELPKIVKDVQILTGNINSAFYFLSDGYPNDRSPESEVYKNCAALKNIFGVKNVTGYGNYYGRSVLLTMAEKMGGTMNHVTDYTEMKTNYRTFFKGKKVKKNIKIDQKYDLVWQVTNDIVILEQNPDNSVDVFETDSESNLFAINMSELDSLKVSDLEDAAFVYSLAYVLSQKNKANLGVSVLRKATASNDAKTLQKSFTVLQKGRAENDLKSKALVGGLVLTEEPIITEPLSDFVESVEKQLGNISIDMSQSVYTSITRKSEDVSKVEFETTDKTATIIGITGNEDRANISFLTVRKGNIIKVNDVDLQTRIDEFNKNTKGKKIEFPIESTTFRNYAFVANGDFNFEKITLVAKDKTVSFVPEKHIDLFDENAKVIKISDFTNLYKTLIAEKAHVSVLNFYIKNNSAVKHLDDLRVKEYGVDAIPLLEELGLDYQLRYSPKRGSYKRPDDADYIPFLEMSAQLKGAATINAKASYEKFLKKGKQNPGDLITWPLFTKYDSMLQSLGKDEFVKYAQSTVEGLETTVDRLKQKISGQKFYILTTNSWFEGVDKADEVEFDGLLIKVTEEKEYL